MSTLDKILSLWKESEKSQQQAIELLIGLNDLHLIRAFRNHIDFSVTISEARWAYLHAAKEQRISLKVLDNLIEANIVLLSDVKHVFCLDLAAEELETLISQYPALETLKVKSTNNYWNWRSSGVALTELPENIGSLIQLKHLYIENHMDLQNLPDSMNNLTQLEKVSFARTGLSALPAWLMDCPQLSVLNLNGMYRLRAIHPALMNHPSLKIIHASQHSPRGPLIPALPNTERTHQKYTQPNTLGFINRVNKNSTRHRQDAYFSKKYNPS